MISRLVLIASIFTSSSLMPIMALRAEASVPLWQNIINKLSKAKNIVIYNEVGEDVNQSIQNQSKQKKDTHQKKEKKNIPEENSDLKEIERQAEYASKVTGVRKDFLMGMLVVESAMGQNTGQCTYKDVSDGAEEAHASGRLSDRAWETFLERKETIREIANELGYDYENLKVSCNPAYEIYAGTGGAMGIPQFMPDTWLEYKDRIAGVVGKEHPDPWDTRDGVVAMALKVADVPGVVDHNVWAERAASKLYLSGTTSWRYDWYANQIQYWASNYEKLFG